MIRLKDYTLPSSSVDHVAYMWLLGMNISQWPLFVSCHHKKHTKPAHISQGHTAKSIAIRPQLNKNHYADHLSFTTDWAGWNFSSGRKHPKAASTNYPKNSIHRSEARLCKDEIRHRCVCIREHIFRGCRLAAAPSQCSSRRSIVMTIKDRWKSWGELCRGRVSEQFFFPKGMLPVLF